MIEKWMYFKMNYPKEKKKKIIIAIIISAIIIIGLIIFLVLFFIKKDDDDDEINTDYYLYENLITAINKTIINSFKKGGENYNEILGDINDGNDYEESERNNFDLCIPYHINKRKNKYNRILLYIHGGGWISGEKNNVKDLCQRYEKYDFISASMTYTIFNGTYNNTNMFRLIDEITYAIKAIKVFLKEKGFDENKFELVLGGGSAGAHLSMLYSYMIKNPPIPIKFVYDNVGPVTIDPKYFFYTKIYNDSLENIEPEDIEKAFTEISWYQ